MQQEWAYGQKGVSVSYLRISAAFFDTAKQVPVHVMLNRHLISHPHTGDVIGPKVLQSFCEWGISPRNILMIVTDNGSNMLKAVRNLHDNTVDKVSDDNADDDDDTEADEVDVDEGDFPVPGVSSCLQPYHQLPCFAQGLQLVVHSPNKVNSYLTTVARPVR